MMNKQYEELTPEELAQVSGGFYIPTEELSRARRVTSQTRVYASSRED